MHGAMRRVVLVLGLVSASFGCSSSDGAETTAPGDAPGPITVESPAYDLLMTVHANYDAERIVDGSFRTGFKPGISCTEEQIAGCTLSVCTKTDDATPGTAVDPGKITASSPSFGEAVEIPVADGYGRVVQSGAFPDGEEVRLVGAGSAEVAPFDLKVRVPASFQLKTIGACSSDAECALPAGDVVVTWSGGSGTLSVSLQEILDVDPRASLSCRFAAAAGKGRIPGEALAKLPRKYAYSVGLTGFETTVASTAGAGLHVGVRSMRWSNKSGPKSVTLP